MRQHGATHRSDSVARSTPTAQQERPNKTFHLDVPTQKVE